MTDRTIMLATTMAAACICASSSLVLAGEHDLVPGASPKVAPVAPGDAAKPRSATSAAAAAPKPAPDGCATVAIIEPTALFQQLVARYRGLAVYRDTARIVHVTHRMGEETSRIETEIDCEIRDGDLKVTTPASQIRSSLGFDLPVRKSQAVESADRGYDLWLAPHMTLRFVDDPLKSFRNGVEEGFTPIDAELVTIDNRDMLLMELRSGDGLSESCTAKFDLFINPETMLVERIDGEQHMPDGARCTTSMHITPHVYEFDVEPAAQR